MENADVDILFDATNDIELHRFNECLPEYVSSVNSEAKSLTDDISGGFEEWKTSQQQSERGNVAVLMRSARLLQSFLDLKYSLKDETRILFLNQMRDIAFADKAPLSVQVKMFQMMEKLLHKRVVPLDYEISWRPAYQLLWSHHLRPSAHPPVCSAQNEGNHRHALVSVIYHQRHYHGAQAAKDIWEEQAPFLREFGQQNCMRALALLTIFMPSKHGLYSELLPEWLRLWASMDNCPEWDTCWLILLCRARKHTAPEDWATVLPQIFAQASYALCLPVGKGERAKPRKFPNAFKVLLDEAVGVIGGICEMRKLAKLVVFAMGHGPTVEVELPTGDQAALEKYEVSTGTRLLLQLLNSTRTYLHPSNHGKWSSNLATFIGWVCAALCRRVGSQWGIASNDGRGGLQGGYLPITKVEARAVVKTLLPLVQQMLYSKVSSISEVAQRCLKHLCCLSPYDVSHAILQSLGGALDPAAVNQTHQLGPALHTLGLLIRPLLHPRPLIAPYLPSILELSLPGLDANDVKKTIVTLLFYHHICNWIPISSEDTSMSEEAALPADLPQLCVLNDDLPEGQLGGQFCGSEADLYDSARRLTKYLGGWSLQVLDRLFKLVENLEAPSKITGDGSILDKLAGSQDMAMMFTLSRCVESLFQQMDDNVHAEATQKVLAFVTGNCLPDAVKKVALLVESCVGTRSSALQVLVPALMEGLPGSPSSGAQELSSRETLWRLRLLAAGMKAAGEGILQYSDALIQIMEACASDENKKVKKGGRKLLRHTLSGLLEYYPLEYRSAAVVAPPVQSWGQPLTCGPDLGVQWHQPSEPGIGFAVRLFETFAGGAMRTLEADMSGNGDVTGRERAELWRSRLKNILYALRGGAAVLQDGDGTEITVQTGYAGPRMIPGLRQQIAAFLHRACGFISSDPAFDGDVKTLKALIEPMVWVLTRRGAKERQAKMGILFLKKAKARHCNQLYNGTKRALIRAGAAKGLQVPNAAGVPLGGNCRPRAYLIERLYYQHLSRQREVAFSIPHKLKGGPLATVYEDLMHDLINLGTKSIYAETRKKAQAAFNDASSFFTWVSKESTAGLVAKVNKEGTTHEEGTGIVHFLSQKRWMRHLAGRWDQVQQFLRNMCESHIMVAGLPKDRQQKMTTRLQNLFIQYLNSWQLVGLYTDQEREDYVGLMRLLAGMVNPGAAGGADSTAPRLHWRYEMLVTWALISLQRKDVVPPPEVYHWLLKAIARDNGQPLQRLALFGLVRLLVLHPSVAGSEHKALLTQESSLQAFCWALLYNHTRTTETESTSAEAARWSVGVMDMVKDAAREGRSIFPHSRIPHCSYVFKTQNARAVKAMVHCFGQEILPDLLRCISVIQDQAPDEDQQKAHATAAEVLAGSLRALNKDVGTSPAVYEVVLPFLQEMTNKASEDRQRDLADCVMYAVAKRQLQNVRPLLDHILVQVRVWLGASDGKDLKGAGAAQAKVLMLLIACLAETVAYGPSRKEVIAVIAQDVVPLVVTRCNLAHPFKVVREYISMLLYIIGPYVSRLDQPESNLATERMALLMNAVKEVVGEEVSMENVLQREATDPSADGEETQSSIERGDEESGKSERARILETIVGWIYFASKMGDTLEYLPDLLPLFPALLEAVRDPEPQIQQAAAQTLGTLAQSMFGRADFTLQNNERSSAMITTIVQLTSKLAGHSSWYSRRACLEFIGIFQAHHHFNLPEEDHSVLDERLADCLSDERKEAQDTACYALTTRVAFLEPQQALALSARFEEMASAALKKYKIIAKRLKAAKSEEEKEDLNKKLIKNTKKHKKGVLGLASIILASPYDLPKWLPSSLTSLAAHEGIPMGIGETVRKTFTDFKRTHQDSWEIHRQRFTRDQLDIVNSMLISPSYYA